MKVTCHFNSYSYGGLSALFVLRQIHKRRKDGHTYHFKAPMLQQSVIDANPILERLKRFFKKLEGNCFEFCIFIFRRKEDYSLILQIIQNFLQLLNPIRNFLHLIANPNDIFRERIHINIELFVFIWKWVSKSF